MKEMVCHIVPLLLNISVNFRMVKLCDKMTCSLNFSIQHFDHILSTNSNIDRHNARWGHKFDKR